MHSIHFYIDKIPRWLLTVLTAGAICYATLAPHPAGADVLPMFPGADKVVHFIMFATLTAALLFDLRRTKKAAAARRIAIRAAVASMVFGAVDEIMQSCLTTVRSGDILDWLADMAGTCAMLLIFLIWRRQRRHKVHRPACRG